MEILIVCFKNKVWKYSEKKLKKPKKQEKICLFAKFAIFNKLNIYLLSISLTKLFRLCYKLIYGIGKIKI